MANKSKVKPFLFALAVVAISVTVLFILYQVSVPARYNLKVGDKVPDDIFASRAMIDHRATTQRATTAASQVADIMVRSAKISDQCLERIDSFFTRTDKQREVLYGKASGTAGKKANTTPATKAKEPSQEQLRVAAQQVADSILADYGLELNTNDISALLGLEQSIYDAFRLHTETAAKLIMGGEQGSFSLQVAITTQVNEIRNNNEFYSTVFDRISTFLRIFLKPNMVYDQEATRAAREAAAAQVRANPIYLPAGSRIAAAGETLTQETYDTLLEMDLIQTGQVNWNMLISLLCLYFIVMGLMWLYLRYYERGKFRVTKDRLIALLTLLAVLLISAYISKISPLLIPVYFAAIVLSSYFGLRTSLVMTSLLILLLYPVTNLNPQFLFVSIMGSWAAALIAAGQSRKRNYVSVILGTTLVCFVTSVLYSTMTQSRTSTLLENAGLVTISGLLSAILAVGLSPIYELMLSSVSPVALIKLAEPSQPLLRKLFLEAPGTYQHSMMVANLAEAAAERIGADALLVRVGAYYHDIGKTWNAQMFTENQQGFNPHSLLNTEESVRVIFRHVTAGEEMARRYRLPQEIINFISTHHGTTVLAYFYSQACEEAKEKGLPAPDPKDFTYPGVLPMSRETGLFMLADTTEAAMKSAGINHLEGAEKLIRKLVRAKIDQDQLVKSGLSFRDVEEIIQAFLQVYAGQFHERIKYPDAHPVSESAK